MRIIFVLLFSFTFVQASPLSDWITVDDGLAFGNVDNIADDNIRLTLLTPSYATAANIKRTVEVWLGPDMVRIENDTQLLIQAPRDSSARVEFIAALLELEIPD